MKNAGKARSYGLYRHLRTSKEIIENLLNYSDKNSNIVNLLLLPRLTAGPGSFPIRASLPGLPRAPLIGNWQCEAWTERFYSS